MPKSKLPQHSVEHRYNELCDKMYIEVWLLTVVDTPWYRHHFAHLSHQIVVFTALSAQVANSMNLFPALLLVNIVI